MHYRERGHYQAWQTIMPPNSVITPMLRRRSTLCNLIPAFNTAGVDGFAKRWNRPKSTPGLVDLDEDP